MASYIWHNDRWMEKDVVLAIRAQQPSNRSHDVPMPMIIPDRVEYRSMITGEMITGRRQHREHIKQHDVIELGNERIKPVEKSARERKNEIAQDIKTAIEQLEAGYVPPAEKEEGVEEPQVDPIDVSEIQKDGQYIRGGEAGHTVRLVTE